MSWTAKYNGKCGSCGGRIVAEEDEIAYEGTGELVHVSCGEAQAGEVAAGGAAGVCPGCWTELPVSGVCGAC